MAEQDAVDWEQELGLDRVPEHIVGKRITELMDLSGKRAVVTGAGAGGLGQAIAHRLAGLGADVALLDRDYDGAARNAEAVARQWGVNTVPIGANLSDWDEMHRAVTESTEALGGLDIMINNAVTVSNGAFETITKQDIDLTVHGTLTMCMYGARAALEHMLPQGKGRIINIASVGGRTDQPGLTVYNSGKSGVIGFTRNLASEFASRGISVLGVAPGVMMSPGLKQTIMNPGGDDARAGRDSVRHAVTNQIKMGRVSLPEEAANVVGFLSTEAADYMCGVTIDVSGGQWMG